MSPDDTTIVQRVGWGLLHGLLNAALVMSSSKYFYLAFERLGRSAGLDDGPFSVIFAVLIVLGTVVFWLIPMRHRGSRSVTFTAVSVIVAGIFTFLVMKPRG